MTTNKRQERVIGDLDVTIPGKLGELHKGVSDRTDSKEDITITFNIIFEDTGEIRQKKLTLAQVYARIFQYELRRWAREGEILEYKGSPLYLPTDAIPYCGQCMDTGRLPADPDDAAGSDYCDCPEGQRQKSLERGNN